MPVHSMLGTAGMCKTAAETDLLYYAIPETEPSAACSVADSLLLAATASTVPAALSHLIPSSGSTFYCNLWPCTYAATPGSQKYFCLGFGFQELGCKRPAPSN